MNLVDKIREARKLEIKIGDATYHARRPTYEEFGSLYRENLKDPEIARQFVYGWSGVKESDLFKGGSGALVEFDKALWDEAISDMPEVWKEVVNRILEATQKYHEVAEDARKNFPAGSN